MHDASSRRPDMPNWVCLSLFIVVIVIRTNLPASKFKFTDSFQNDGVPSIKVTLAGTVTTLKATILLKKWLCHS